MYLLSKILKNDISNIIKDSGVQFFEINKLVNLNNAKADLLYEINSSIHYM